MSSSSDDLGDFDGYFEQLPFDPRETDHSEEIQDLYGQVSDDIVQVMEDLTRQRDDATDSAIESMMSETYNQGVIDGVLAGADVSGDNTENYFPNGILGDGNYRSPVFDFTENSSSEAQTNYESPVFKFGDNTPRGFMTSTGGDLDSNIEESWDDYDWSGWDNSGDEGFETPSDYADSVGVNSNPDDSGVSITVKYNGYHSEGPEIDFTGHEASVGSAC
jgi:hypothetical protein